MNAEASEITQTAPDHFAALRAYGVPEGQVAALEAIVVELADAVHHAYSALKEAETVPQDRRHFQATSERWKLAFVCARVGYPIKDRT